MLAAWRAIVAGAGLFWASASCAGLAPPPLEGQRLEGTARAAGAGPVESWRVAAWQCGPRLGIEWRTEDGRPSASEDVMVEPGDTDRLAAYRLVRDNLGQRVDGVVRDGVLELEIRDSGRTRITRIEAPSGLLAGPMLVRHVQRNLGALRAGRELRVDYLLGERGTILGLRLARDRESQSGPGITVRVDAASAMLRPLVPTTRMSFSADGMLVGVTGRLLPQVGTAGSPRPVDGELRLTEARGHAACARPSGAT